MTTAVNEMQSAEMPRSIARSGLRLLFVDPDEARRKVLQRWLESRHEVHVAADAQQAVELAKEIIPSVIVVDAATNRATCVVEHVLEVLAVFEIGVILIMDVRHPAPDAWSNHVHLRRPFTKAQLLHCLGVAASPHLAPAAMLRRERQRREEAETLLDLALELTSRIDLRDLLQCATNTATQLTGAAFGAFFYNSVERGQRYPLYASSGASMEAFKRFVTLRSTALFVATFSGESVIRCDDVTRDPLYCGMDPRRDMSAGNLPVRSYLAVPVVSRTEVLGGLFFGHPEPVVFTQRSERLAAAIAAQTAVAIENSRLFSALLRSQET